MHKELHAIKLIREYLIQNKIVNYDTTNIDDIYNVFRYLADVDNINKFNSLYILNYINNYLVSEDVAKRKTSARIFEDLISILFNGRIADNFQRKNIVTEVPEYFKFDHQKIASNKREKVDIIFSYKYGISIKTLMDSNNEINLGSFEKRVLFHGFHVDHLLNERKSNNNEDMGLGSKKQLKMLLNHIKDNGFYQEFSDRLVNMYKFIFADDMIVAIKSTNKLMLYFCTGQEFCQLISDRVDDIDSLLTIINRWEGNSIRIDRTILLNSINRFATLDFNLLKQTIIYSINNFDMDLHEMYVHYANLSGDTYKRNDILTSLSNIFEQFDDIRKGL
jgi:hypothetical protein